MKIAYVGNRAHHTTYGDRIAEVYYSDKEEEKALDMAWVLEMAGWKVDTGIYGVFYVKVEDREDYDELVEMYKDLKKELA